jgi:heme exporter protein A
MTFSNFRLEVEGLACRRGVAAIFDGVSFFLEGGGALVVRGANGSGKSSLLRVLCGLMKPAAGEVRLMQEEGPVEEIARHAHYFGHQPAVTSALTVRSNLAFQAALLGNAGARLSPILERVGLAALASAPARHLSAGQRRRLALARLLVATRPLWLLDEPGESLDAEGEALLAEISAAHHAAGGLIVLATHTQAPLAATAELNLKLAGAP